MRQILVGLPQMTTRQWIGVVAATALVLGGLVVPLVHAIREADRYRVCPNNNLKLIALAMLNYHGLHGCFPPAATFDPNGRPLLSWRVTLLPFMGESALYQKFCLDEPWYSSRNKPLLSKMPAAFACPYNSERQGYSEMSPYQVIVGPRTMFTGRPIGVRLDEVTDGTSDTILVTETNDLAPWTAPHDVAFTTASSFGTCESEHAGGFNTAMADGSVKFIKSTIDPGVFWSLMTRNGGEVIKPEQY
jgi:prepilin-type processing-associated H-X9-DG protein